MDQILKIGQLEVCKMRIEDRECLLFKETTHAKTPNMVLTAMFAVAKYLRWWNNEAINEQTIQIQTNRSGRILYMDGWESMHLTADGRVLWAQISRYNLRTLMSQAARNNLPEMFQPVDMNLLRLISVEKLYLDVELSSEKKEQVKSAFMKFVDDNCAYPGTYDLDFDRFCQDNKLPVPAVWRTLSESFQEMYIDGMFIYAAYCDGKIMQITVV